MRIAVTYMLEDNTAQRIEVATMEEANALSRFLYDRQGVRFVYVVTWE